MIYADNNATHPLLPAVKEYLTTRIAGHGFANPSALHALGKKNHSKIEESRKIIAKIVHADSSQLFFNSGATEGITQVFHTVLKNSDRKIILLSSIEHSAVIENAKKFEIEGFELKFLPASLDIKQFKKIALEYQNEIALVAIMAINNESGEMLPYENIAEITDKLRLPYLCDITQLVGKARFNFLKSKIDYAVFSGHKLGSLPGVGVLLSRSPFDITPLIYGGAQERGTRAGTENYIGIESLAVAISEWDKSEIHFASIKNGQDRFESEIAKKFPEAIIIAKDKTRIIGTTLVGFPGLHSQALQIELESNDIFVTTSAACADNMPDTSHVLKAMGYSDDLGRSVIRISMGLQNAANDYEILFKTIIPIIQKLKKINFKN